jgi:hypothetical protein
MQPYGLLHSVSITYTTMCAFELIINVGKSVFALLTNSVELSTTREATSCAATR